MSSPSLRKVAIYYERLTGPGGAERQAIEDYKYLRKRGVEAKFLTHHLNADALFGLPPNVVDILENGGPAKRVAALRRALIRFQPDVVSVHSGHIEAYLALLGTGIPYIFHHNSPVLLYSQSPEQFPRRFYSWIHHKAFCTIRERYRGSMEYLPASPPIGILERPKVELEAVLNLLAIRRACAVVTLSERTVKEIRLMYGRDAVCVRGCLDPAIFDYEPVIDVRRVLNIRSRWMLLSVSRLTFEKRVDLVIKSFARLRAMGWDIVLVIGGMGPEKERLQQLADSLGVGDVTKFVGFIPETQLWDYYSACDVFVSPAWADFNIAPYEALALGRKVVWSSEMEVEDWLASSGLIFGTNPSVEDCVEALVRALSDEHKCVPDMSCYTWDTRFSKVYDLYHRTIS